MPLARKHHILIPVEADAYWPARPHNRQGRESSWSRRLGLLASKAPAHPRNAHHHLVRGNMQNMRNALLHLGGMLGRRSDMHRSVLSGFSKSCVHL